MFGELRDSLGHDFGQRAAFVLLVVPLFGDHIGEEPVQFRRIVNQLFEQVAQIPADDSTRPISNTTALTGWASDMQKAPGCAGALQETNAANQARHNAISPGGP